jgi:hypothetical protein
MRCLVMSERPSWPWIAQIPICRRRHPSDPMLGLFAREQLGGFGACRLHLRDPRGAKIALQESAQRLGGKEKHKSVILEDISTESVRSSSFTSGPDQGTTHNAELSSITAEADSHPIGDTGMSRPLSFIPSQCW